MWTESPSIHQPERSTSGSMLQPVPSDSSPGHRRQRMELDVAADFRAEGPGVVRHPRGAGQADGAGQVLDLFGQPQAQVHPARAGVASGGDVAQQEPRRGHRDRHPTRRADEHQPGRAHPPPGQRRRRRETGQGGQQVVRRHEVREPAHPDEDVQRNAQQRLRPLGAAGRGTHGAFAGRGGPALGQGLARRVDQGADPGRGIDVRHRDRGVADPQGGDELGRGQRAAAEGEEVGVQVGHGPAQHGTPLLDDPAGVVGQVQRRRRGIGVPPPRPAATAGRAGPPCRWSWSAGRPRR